MNTPQEYTNHCKKTIARYKTLAEHQTVPSIVQFCQEYDVDCKAALNRFEKMVPGTLLHGGASESKGKELSVFHCVQHFITTMDSLKLEMRAVDELHPSMSDLMDSINKVMRLPQNHVSREKVQTWLMTLSRMKATDELTDEQVRQMSFDLDAAYNAFHRFVQEGA